MCIYIEYDIYIIDVKAMTAASIVESSSASLRTT